jgi:hypothetical protein
MVIPYFPALSFSNRKVPVSFVATLFTTTEDEFLRLIVPKLIACFDVESIRVPLTEKLTGVCCG